MDKDNVLREVLASLSAQRQNLPEGDPLPEVYVTNYYEQLDQLEAIGISTSRFRIPITQVQPIEITHGVVENTANLGWGEAGALNEAFADIFGTCVEKFGRPLQHDWIITMRILTNHSIAAAGVAILAASALAQTSVKFMQAPSWKRAMPLLCRSAHACRRSRPRVARTCQRRSWRSGDRWPSYLRPRRPPWQGAWSEFQPTRLRASTSMPRTRRRP